MASWSESSVAAQRASRPSQKSGVDDQAAPTATPPGIALPKGGGAIRGMGEKFAANPVTGTGSMSVPIATSPGRSGFGPQLALSYDSGSGNGPFGLGWSLSLPSITRKTDRGLPRYRDAEDSDVFLLSGAEDLVPVLVESPEGWQAESVPPRQIDGVTYTIRRYRPRIEGLFARIERWTRQDDPADVHWRSTTRDNVLTLYGKDANARIADPTDPTRIFSWLICETRDDKGNAVLYHYKAEDGADLELAQAHERNRGGADDTRRRANRYIKRILYGNRTPLLDANAQRPPFLSQEQTAADWMFEVVFDYGEHDADVPRPDDNRVWRRRNDPFSSYRAGFEVRTYRLCQRVLMFHHFPEEPEVLADCLVHSTDFTYSHEQTPNAARDPVYSCLLSVAHRGYRRQGGGYASRGLPPLTFDYTQAVVQAVVEEVDATSLENLPAGLNDGYQWTDLHGEGLPGILTEQGGAWFYKRNLSPLRAEPGAGAASAEVRFAPVELVATRPNLALGDGAQFMDLAGDGQPDLVVLDGPLAGLFEHDDAESWEPFRPFTAHLSRDLRDPNLRFVDLTGDGHADILITEDDTFTWYPSRQEAGFGPDERVHQVLDEERGPRLVFADGEQAVYLADLSGDGLTDLARVRNGEVCYWPNLGYGRFGPKVTMDSAPWFDTPDLFEQRRIRLADIDGSGTTDILYLGRDAVRLYFNQSGNRWGAAQTLDVFPQVDSLTDVTTADLLGNGTACLVWSSPLPGDAPRPMRYVNLMGDEKPHLLVRTVNNLGAETRVHYAPSTKFYLQDRRDGRPWITRLPFPVHVVERVETFDHLSRNRFVTRYAYHHGYFDGEEREFRGFGMVEQLDTEAFASLSESGELPAGDNVAAASHVPPVLSRSWFHTGVSVNHNHVSQFFAGLQNGRDRGEYYREPAWLDDDDEARKHLLPDTTLPGDLTLEEAREAARALKGLLLRQEIYALDGVGRDADFPDGHPYSVAEQTFSVRLLQPRGDNPHAVFFTHPGEALTYHYEREPANPRIQHALTLEVDGYGNVLKAAAIGYGRGEPDATLPTDADRLKQTTALLTYTENDVTNPIDDPILFPADYRTPLPAETRTYELTGYTPTGELGRYRHEDFVQPDSVHPERMAHRHDGETAYEATPPAGRQRRLIERARTRYRPDDLGSSQNDPRALLPLGMVEPLALPGESYQLAFTPGLLARVYRRPLDTIQGLGGLPPETLLPELGLAQLLGGAGGDQGGYVELDGDGHWWMPSGRVLLSPTSGDSAADELGYARQHFFLPHRFRDPFHTDAVSTESSITYDRHDLLVLESRDALGNRVSVGQRLPSGDLDPAIRGNDYRVLQARLVTDANGNRAEVAFDLLGLVAGTAEMGKPAPAPVAGDSLAVFEADLIQAQLDAFFDAADPHAVAPGLLKDATTRIVYDLDRFQRTRQAHPDQSSKWQPASTAIIARETHVRDLEANEQSRVHISFSYSDGFSREIQMKVQAEPGPVPQRDSQGKIIVGTDGQPLMTAADISPRWVGSGWTVFNNKGQPVRQYEPFFTDTLHFEFDVRIGVSPVLFYDPVERVVATLHPNHTWEKVVFDPWQQTTFDVNDTVALDPQADDDVKGFFLNPDGTSRLPRDDYRPSWHALRTDPAHATDFAARYPDPADRANETRAAAKAAAHAETPTKTYLDTMGRPFLTVAHNRVVAPDHERNGTEEKLHTRVELDIEGNQRAVRDAIEQDGDPLGRVVMRYDHDMLGNRIHLASMEAGERWMLDDVTGQPIRAWDSRGHEFRSEYDPLRRPRRSFVAGADPTDPARELLTDRLVYGEQHPEAEARNLRGTLYLALDQAGAASSEAHDFKGNLLASTRRLAREYRQPLDWRAMDAALPGGATTLIDPAALETALAPLLEADIYTSRTTFDALNRPTELTAPDSSVVRPTYNDANLLERVDVNLQGATVTTPFVTDIDYDAKGQRRLIEHGNGVRTAYDYDPLTFRLSHLQTVRGAEALQDLHYTYDPVGNITAIRDDAQQTIFFRNQRVEPSADYTYDALYRLIEATGREHLGQSGGQRNPPTPLDALNSFHTHLDHPGDGNAMGTYIERYVYDAVGNFIKMQHRGSDPAHPGWTRAYAYLEPSLLEDAKLSNRLTRTAVGMQNAQPVVEPYTYDTHGNAIHMPHLPLMQWDYRDQLQATSQQVRTDGGTPETTYYVYDSDGQRARKVTERQAAAGQTPTRKEERIYLGGFEMYREYNGSGATVTLERETLHIMDDMQRVALVETRTRGEDDSPRQLIRYQFGNHLGSASLELDGEARIISYEEYYPYGSTSYQAVRSGLERNPKRYRYTGMERDEESGLEYHGARYYAPWLGRWTSCDPIGVAGGIDLYVYAGSNPAGLIDPTGTDDIPSWYTEVTRETKDAAEIQRRLQNLDARGQELRKLVALTGLQMLPSSTGKPEDAYIVEGLNLSPGELTAISREQSLISHAQGTLITMLKVNQRRWEIDPVRERTEQLTGKKWEDLSGSAKSYWRMKLGHPEWQVRPNIILDMTGSIVEESQSTDVQIIHNSLMGGLLATAMRPNVPTRIGASGTLDDCAACTASRAIDDLTGVEVSAKDLISKYGLPQKTNIGFNAALDYAKNYLTRVLADFGLKLAEKPGGFAPIAKGGTEGTYAVFLEGGRAGGHVVYGNVTKSGITVTDYQLGKTWSSLDSAASQLGMKPRAAYRIENVQPVAK
jgi:RHS repeat-associated protein